METSNVLEPVRKEVQQYFIDEYMLLKDTIEAIEIRNDEDMGRAGEFRKKVNDFVKKIEERRKSAVKPFNDLVKDINGEFKTALNLFEPLLKKIDEKCKPYLLEVARAKEQAAIIAREKELAEMERKKQEAAKLAQTTEQEEFVDIAANISEEQEKLAEKEIVVHKNVKSDSVSTALVDNWKHRIINENEVDRALCSPDDKKIKAAMKGKDKELKEGAFKLAGIEFYNEPYLSSRAR